ncbi:hypothetical protein NEISICOT_03428 [Neisseria sicca ATCC 29256]|uniref:Uncharacterized protein n=1 Tax=Neisseria sicca ATCC 29256 TaxID=547045 RepID=C6MA47_NEISI|nr:hypothetical protein [Neisseria sicca]EET42843.1 hypothetical protein NEISICOT_03428 [Neisseria sicca ATCC 29256]
MFELQNFTCFHTQQFKNIDQTDRAYDVVVAKVSYEFEIDPETGKTELAFARKQTPLTFADTYYGDPSQTSTQFESDYRGTLLGAGGGRMVFEQTRPYPFPAYPL